MAKADLEEFYEMVAAGDTVVLVGERNEETALLFGDGEKPTVSTQQPTLLAKNESAVMSPAPEQTTSTSAPTATETMTAGSVGVTGKW